jgi:hypothetical protein
VLPSKLTHYIHGKALSCISLVRGAEGARADDRRAAAPARTIVTGDEQLPAEHWPLAVSPGRVPRVTCRKRPTARG